MQVFALAFLASVGSAHLVLRRSVTCGLALNKEPCSFLPDPSKFFCCDYDSYHIDNRLVYCDQAADTVVQGTCGDHKVCKDDSNGEATCVG